MNTINFLPASYLADRQRRQRIRRQLALIVLAVLAMGGWYVFASGRQSGLEQQASALERQADAVQALAAQATVLQNQRALMRQQVRVQQELTQPINHSQIIATLGQLMPQRMTLTSFVLLGRKPNLSAPEAVEGRTTTASRSAVATEPDLLRISINALAMDDLDLASFLGALDKTPLFTNVKMLYSRATEVNQTPMRECRIEMEVPLERNFRSKSQEVAHAH